MRGLPNATELGAARCYEFTVATCRPFVCRSTWTGSVDRGGPLMVSHYRRIDPADRSRGARRDGLVHNGRAVSAISVISHWGSSAFPDRRRSTAGCGGARPRVAAPDLKNGLGAVLAQVRVVERENPGCL